MSETYVNLFFLFFLYAAPGIKGRLGRRKQSWSVFIPQFSYYSVNESIVLYP